MNDLPLQAQALPRRVHPRDITRFLTHVKVFTDLKGTLHWLWTGCRSGTGYGKFKLRGDTLYAHRVSYAIFCGDVPAGLWVNHTSACLLPRCVHPAHLELMTADEQRADRWKRFHAAAEQGELCPF